MRAFVVGSGASLKQMDLDRLIGEVTFGMNRVDLVYEPAPDYGIRGTRWRPTYYLFIEWLVADSPLLAQSVEQSNPFEDFVIPHHVAPGVEHCLLRASHRVLYDAAKVGDKRWRNRRFDNVRFVPIDCEHAGMYTASPEKPDGWHLPTWCKYGGTMNIALQFAFAMGFEPVYVIACDLGFQPIYRTCVTDPNHFHPDYWTWEDNPLEDRDDTLHEMHAIARHEFEKAGRHIYNAGIGGKLEAYERVSFEEVLR